MAARGTGRARAAIDESQFELFSFTSRGYEAARPIPRHAEATEGQSEKDSCAVGRDEASKPVTAENPPSTDSAPSEAGVGPWPGFGNEAETIHLPPSPRITPLPDPE